MSRRPRILVALVVWLAPSLALVACGDDDGGPSAFCEQAEEGTREGETEVDALDRLIDVAPPEVARDLVVLRDDVAERAADGGDPTIATDDPELEEVLLRVFTFVSTECADAGG